MSRNPVIDPTNTEMVKDLMAYFCPKRVCVQKKKELVSNRGRKAGEEEQNDECYNQVR